MTELRDWQPTDRYESCGGIGTRVERAGQLGFAKLVSIEKEKLAADLGKLVEASVPQVKIGTLGGQRCAISYVHGPRSRSLSCFKSEYPTEVKDALRTASALLPFLAWLQSYDHVKDENFVVDYPDNEPPLIRAIDFEHAFDWIAGEETIIAPKPSSVVANVDPQGVLRMLMTIEGLSLAQIADCCAPSGLGIMADVLHRRQHLLRQAMRECGWL